MSTRAVLLAAALAGAVALAWAATSADSADAAVYCAPAPCDEGTAVATIGEAVALADADAAPDTVAIEPGVHNTPDGPCGGLFVTEPTTTVQGAGVGETILTFPPPDPDFGSTRSVICGHMQLQDTTLRLPSDVTPTHNSNVQGVDLYSGSIRRVRVDAPGAIFGSHLNDGTGTGMLVRGGVLRRVEVKLGLRRDTEGISTIGLPDVRNIDVTARDSGFVSRVDQQPGDPPMRVERLTSRSRQPLTVLNETGVNSTMLLSDALLDASDVPRRIETSGVTVVNGLPPEAVKLKMDRVTIVGNRSNRSYAMGVFGQGQPLPTVLRARHTVAAGFRDTLLFGLFGGDAKAVIDYSNLDLRPRKIRRQGSDGQVTKRFGPRIRGGNPRFRNRRAADFRLRRDSPAVDIGGADLIPGGPFDLRGAPRPADGDGDGRAQNDAGAFERHRPR